MATIETIETAEATEEKNTNAANLMSIYRSSEIQSNT